MKEKWSVSGSETHTGPFLERHIWSRYWSFCERLDKNKHGDPLFYFLYFKKLTPHDISKIEQDVITQIWNIITESIF